MDEIIAQWKAEGLRVFRVTGFPAENSIEWGSSFCDRDQYVTIIGGVLLVGTTGNCTAPGAQEVI